MADGLSRTGLRPRQTIELSATTVAMFGVVVALLSALISAGSVWLVTNRQLDHEADRTRSLEERKAYAEMLSVAETFLAAVFRAVEVEDPAGEQRVVVTQAGLNDVRAAHGRFLFAVYGASLVGSDEVIEWAFEAGGEMDALIPIVSAQIVPATAISNEELLEALDDRIAPLRRYLDRLVNAARKATGRDALPRFSD